MLTGHKYIETDFSRPLLPGPVMAVINFLAFIWYGVCGVILVSLHLMIFGYTLTQSYYLLRNENKGKERVKDYIELFIIHLVMFLLITKLSEFFERQINKLMRNNVETPTNTGDAKETKEVNC